MSSMRGAAIATNCACMFKGMFLDWLTAATDHGKACCRGMFVRTTAIVAAMAALPRAAAGGGTL